MELKFTRPPWAGPFSRESYAGHALISIEGTPGQGVKYAIYPEAETEAEAQANARLFAASPRLLKALAGLAEYANGRLGRNPYGIREFREALEAISEATGHQGNWMDVDVKSIAG